MDTHAADLRRRIAAFDGRAVTILSEIESSEAGQDGYVDALIALADDESDKISAGATWLIKSALENGMVLSADQISALLTGLDGISAWDAQLHICQSIRHMDVAKPDCSALIKWLVPLARHEKPFVRAWSLDAICHLAERDPDYAAVAQDRLAAARSDDAASVRARARNLSR